MKTIPDFKEGLQHYCAKNFTGAALCFEKVLNVDPEDKTARFYLDRSAQFMVHGVPPDWHGIEIMGSK